MPDWKKVVGEHMSPTELPPKVREEVIAEIAAHLDETYEDARKQGLTEMEASRRSLQEVENWRVLAANIQRSKSEDSYMNNRTRSLWLPALANLTLAPGLLMILQKAGVHPRVVWVGNMAMVLYLPWLVTLPVFGAVGAFLAQRTHAPSSYRLVSGTAPALAMLGSFAVFLPLSLALGTAHLSGFPWSYFALTILNWVALPAVALLLGALPLLKAQQMSES